MATDQSHSGTDHAHGGTGKYWVVFIALCALTTCSFITTAEWWPFSPGPTWAFMMAVSCTKAMLVILFFMHLLWEANWKYVLTIPAGMMSVFLMLMLVPDIGLRMRNYSEERQVHAAEFPGDDHADEHHDAPITSEVGASLHGDEVHDASEEPADH